MFSQLLLKASNDFGLIINATKGCCACSNIPVFEEVTERIFTALSQYLASGRCSDSILGLLAMLPVRPKNHQENNNLQALREIYEVVFSRFLESFDVEASIIPRMYYIEFLASLAPRLHEEARLYDLFLDHFQVLARESDMTALVNFERCPEFRIKFMEKIFEALEEPMIHLSFLTDFVSMFVK
jgi:hypothetical protein